MKESTSIKRFPNRAALITVMLVWLSIVAAIAGGAPKIAFSPPPDGDPRRTQFRGPILRLLDDQRVVKALDLPDDKRANLVLYLRMIQEREGQFPGQTAQMPAISLGSSVWERHLKARRELSEVLGKERLDLLTGFAVQAWGLPVLFLPGVGEELGITETQYKSSVDVIADCRQKLVEAAKQLPTGSAAVEGIKKDRDHRLLEILNRGQQERLPSFLGPALAFQPNLATNVGPNAAQAKAGPTRLYRNQYRFLRLLQVDDVLDEMHLSDKQRGSLSQWVAKKRIEESALTMVSLNGGKSANDPTVKLRDFDNEITADLSTWLPPGALPRLRQLQFQVQGASAIFLPEARKELAISEDQASRLQTEIRLYVRRTARAYR